MIRDEPAPADTSVLVRAAAASVAATVEDMVVDAVASSGLYVVEVEGLGLEVLYGSSFFARRPGISVETVLRRFPDAPCYLESSVGRLRAAGFNVLPTGTNADHFDVQLVAGRSPDVSPLLRAEVVAAARRLVAATSGLIGNPGYAGPADEEPENR